MLSTLESFIPTNKQICEYECAEDVRCKLEQLAIHILQRLLGPLLKRWRGRRARAKLLQRLLRQHFPGRSAQGLCMQAILQRSMLAEVTPYLNAQAAAEGTRRNPSKAPLRKARSGTEDPLLSLEADPSKANEDGTPFSAVLPPIIALPSLAGVVKANFSENAPASRRASLSVSLTQAQSKAVKAFKEVVSSAIDCSLTIRAFLKGEVVQWPMEPAHEVLILLEGSLARAVPRKVGKGDSHTFFSFKAFARPPPSSAVEASLQNIPSPANFSLDAHERHSILQPGATIKGHLELPQISRGDVEQHAPSKRWQGKHFPADYVVHRDLLSSPSVLGESSCIGGFPFCAEIVVHSERALIASLPFDAYCRIVSALPLNYQRRLLMRALRQRELLMPYFAPMTQERICMCPFLSRLKPENINHLKDYLVPRVYAAGMLCSESTNPKHIFFIRRGIACLERENRNIVETLSPSCPRSRVILTEGHTFGEVQCIFRESLGDLFYAVNNIDMYVLRFDVLIRLMKQSPAVHKAVIVAASILSKLNAKEAPSLSFNLRGVDIGFLRTVAKRQNIMLELANAHPDSVEAVGNNLSSGHPGSILDNLESSAFFGTEMTFGTTKRRTHTIQNKPASPPNFSSIIRGDPSVFTKVMKRIPLLGLVANEEDLGELSAYWRCISFRKGDLIVRRGEECNRLLYFSEGCAGIILDENRIQQEVRALNPFSSGNEDEVELKFLSTQEIFPIPSGHVIGYTCVRRHRWTHSVIAMEDNLEVWVLERAVLVSFLWKFNLDNQMQSATLQVLQPLVLQRDRIPLLDYQPLFSSFPNSLWSEHPIPNLHPVSIVESKVVYPVWQEGDFPLS